MALEAIMLFFRLFIIFLFFLRSFTFDNAITCNPLKVFIYRNMIMYAWYAAKLVTPRRLLLRKGSCIQSLSKNRKMPVHQENNR
jgi:hypothetical protein